MTQKFGYEISRSYSVGVSKLFHAMLDGEILKSLWSLQNITISDKGERKAYAEMQLSDENWNFELIYTSIVEDQHLGWKVVFDRFPGKEILMSITFNGDDARGEMVVNQSNFDSEAEKEANRNAWTGSLEKLEALLSERQDNERGN